MTGSEEHTVLGKNLLAFGPILKFPVASVTQLYRGSSGDIRVWRFTF